MKEVDKSFMQLISMTWSIKGRLILGCRILVYYILVENRKQKNTEEHWRKKSMFFVRKINHSFNSWGKEEIPVMERKKVDKNVSGHTS